MKHISLNISDYQHTNIFHKKNITLAYMYNIYNILPKKKNNGQRFSDYNFQNAFL